jgi:hypothetical protein
MTDTTTTQGTKDDPDSRGGDPQNPAKPSDNRDLGKPDPAAIKRLEALLTKEADRGQGNPAGRTKGLWPYLLVRAFPGDNGKRIPQLPVFWESPDVLVVPGDVNSLDGQTPTLNPQVGVPHTIFVRVWNLGRIPAIGVHLRVYWANPSFSFDPGTPEAPHYIGGTYLNLPDRNSPDCHQVIRIPELWTPVDENGGHECLLAKLECFADPTGDNFDAYVDRHVGQRNLYLAAGDTNLEPLLTGLTLALPRGASLELLHAGTEIRPIVLAHQPKLATVIKTPTNIATGVKIENTPLTHLGAVVAHQNEHFFAPAAALKPVAAAGIHVTALHDTAAASTVAGAEKLAAPVDISHQLIRRLGVANLTASALALTLSKDETSSHLLRFQAVQGGQVVGGYSLIVSA